MPTALVLALLLNCAAQSSDPDPPMPPDFPVPGALDPAYYARVRSDVVLGDALDQRLLPALGAPTTRAERAQAFARLRREAVATWLASPSGTAGPPTEGPGPAAPVDDFNRVCTDALRSWLRTEAVAIAHEDRPINDRVAEIERLADLATSTLDWDRSAAGTAAMELRIEARALQEDAP